MTTEKIVAGLRRALHGARCETLHHGPAEFHKSNEKCPVELMIAEAIEEAITRLQPQNGSK